MKLRIGILALILMVLGGMSLPQASGLAATANHPTGTTSMAGTTGTAADTLSAIPVTGFFPNAGGLGTFMGTLNLQRFTVQGDKLIANGTLSGKLIGATGNTLNTVTSQAITIATTAAGSCQLLHLELGPLHLNLLGLHVDLNRVVLDITAQSGPGNLLGNLLCSVANLLNGNGHGALSGLSGFLNQLIGVLSGTNPTGNPLSAINLTGTAPGGDTFTGVFDLQHFVNQNGNLVATGVLSGTVANAAGNVVKTITNQTATIPLSASGSCQILHLTLGPLNLNLLGLKVNLSKVVLDITAQSGAGNLLGNLLCSVANLLNGHGAVDAIVTALNQLLTGLGGTNPTSTGSNPLSAINLTGTGPGNDAFTGMLNIQHFANQAGNLVATGVLSGTVTNAAGNVVKTITNQTVTLPVSATGSCQILHLTLAPTSLNLLGLKVNLSKVVLDITAQSGAGNLLGNLLCSVANLLNGNGAVDATVTALNQLLSALTGSA